MKKAFLESKEWKWRAARWATIMSAFLIVSLLSLLLLALFLAMGSVAVATLNWLGLSLLKIGGIGS